MYRVNGQDVEDIKRQIFEPLLSSPERRRKYQWFLRAIHAFRYLSLSSARGELLESYYAAMRRIDDIVDGDAPMPSTAQSKSEYVEQRMAFVSNPQAPADPADILLLYCFSLAERLGFGIMEETHHILQSMHFDANRIGRMVPNTDLQYYFYLRDIVGTIKGALKVFGDDPEKCHLLEPLGKASRTYYVVRDYESEVGRGIINISREDCERLDIASKDLESRLTPGIQAWFREQATIGLQLLQQHRTIMAREPFVPLVRVTLPLVYVRPAERYFQGIFNGSIH
ncbi:squalene/phytoene synthase family protein [Candidatus Woesearchaeota archaeon]|nr:squalene/phytoene synthase family protein [Candidatus Woesearchaeota archaeon]